MFQESGHVLADTESTEVSIDIDSTPPENAPDTWFLSLFDEVNGADKTQVCNSIITINIINYSSHYSIFVVFNLTLSFAAKSDCK